MKREQEKAGGMEKRVKEGEVRERNRSASEGNIEEFLKKRKREMRGEEKDNKEEGAFSKSRKTQRSPTGQKGGGEERKSDREKREWKEEMREMMAILMEGTKDVRKQGRNMKEELEEWRKDMAEKEEMWRKERQELRDSITGLKKRVKEMELRAEKTIEEGKGGREGGGKKKEVEIAERMKEIQRKLERKERKDRKRNLIIRGLGVKEEKRREAVVGLLEKIGAKGKVEEVRKLIGGEKGENQFG
ncbi:golgin subfamily A member 6-like protein 22 [Pseudomyrmex gracilis]|uniref:golgin subfamily A member 6-like protein 22 n=1 Tax=Pseudomyrmex gracilis TaxID=219809 RepID=UPI0009954F5A|nr:golgin subfamily A member 6-like protein 22 [Pseudomyrmex gracilis]